MHTRRCSSLLQASVLFLSSINLVHLQWNGRAFVVVVHVRCVALVDARRRAESTETREFSALILFLLFRFFQSRFLYNVHVFSWATPFVLLTIALMAQAAHAEPLSGVCIIGAVGRSNFLMFVVLRDVVVIVASALILGSGCLASATLPAAAPAVPVGGQAAGGRGQSEGFMSSSGIGSFDLRLQSLVCCSGILCAILPAAQAFWLIAALQHMYGGDTFEPVLGVGSMSRLLADPSLGSSTLQSLH